MNINQLEYFVATVRCGSFTLASKELFVTPQAISKAVSELERELHVSLCEKSSHGIKPTAFGTVFSIRASEILSCLFELEALAKSQSQVKTQGGIVLLAVSDAPLRGSIIRPEDLAAFEKSNPHTRLLATFRQSGSCLAALEEGVVDAAIVFGRVNRAGLVCVKLLSFSLRLAIGCNHPLASKRYITLDDLRDIPLAAPDDLRYCHQFITNHFRTKGYEPTYTALDPLPEQHRAFLENEGGAMFVIDDPDLQTLYPCTVTRPIAPEDLMPLPLCLAYPRESHNNALPLVEHYLIGTAVRIQRERAQKERVLGNIHRL